MIFDEPLRFRDPVINAERIAGVAFEMSAFAVTGSALTVSQMQGGPASWLMIIGQEFGAAHEDGHVWMIQPALIKDFCACIACQEAYAGCILQTELSLNAICRLALVAILDCFRVRFNGDCVGDIPLFKALF